MRAMPEPTPKRYVDRRATGLRQPPKLDLPAGYEHFGSSRYRLTKFERLGFVLATILAVPVFMFGGLVLSIFWLPVAFAGYWIVRMLRTRRPSVSGVGRHFRLNLKTLRFAPIKTMTVNHSGSRNSRGPPALSG